MKKWWVGAGFSLLAGVMTACGSQTATAPSHSSTASTAAPSSASPSTGGVQSLTPVTLRLEWVAGGYEAPFVYGVASGIYKKYGLNVTWAFGNGSYNTTELVGAGKVEFGEGDGVSVLQLRAKGIPVTMVMGTMQKAATAVLTSTKYKTPQQLKGATIGVSPGSSSLELLPAFLQSVHLTAKDIKLESMSAAAKQQALLGHKVAAITDVSLDTPPLAAKGFPVQSFAYADYGANMMGYGIVVSEKTLQSEPSVVKRFVEATQAAFLASEQHPNAAEQALVAHANGTAPPMNVLLQELKISEQFATTSNDKGHPFGWMSSKDWTATENLAQKYLGLKTTVPVNQLYTNQFIPATNP